MCATCGCSTDHGHDHPHDRDPGGLISLEQRVLARNDHLAAHNRAHFAARQMLALNLVSSPGAGKTTILERMLGDLRGELVFTVIEGDQETDLDASRIRATGVRAIQINTGAGCHLDAGMIDRAIHELSPPLGSVALIENVGNLVCPALFDLGEDAKVVIASVTEGEDKPLKYPHMFRASRVMLLNKIDLLPHLSFDVSRCVAAARAVNPSLEIFPVSATLGEGLGAFYDWVRRARGARSLPSTRTA